jgi:hypothetical protein
MVKPENTEHPYFTQEGEGQDAVQFIANMRDGAEAAFKYFALDNPEEISATVRGNGRGDLVVSAERGGEALARIPVSPSANWRESPSALKPISGKAALYFTFRGEGSLSFLSFRIGDR